MADSAPPPPSLQPAGRLSDLSKQPSFFGRWLAGAQDPQDQQTQQKRQQQRGNRPSLLGFLFDNGDNDGTSKANAENTGGSSSIEKEKLVQKLTRQLEESGNESFTLTSKELRLLLDLPEKKSLAFAMSDSDDMPCPPPVEPLPVQSSVFDSWDFTSTDDLSGDEIQAIMIALAADQQAAPRSAIMSDSSDNEDDMLAPPALISKNARQVSIQKIDSMEGPQYLVTLGDNNGGEVPPPPPSLLSATGLSLNTHTEEDSLNSSFTSSVSMKPSGLARQFSIQPFPTGESGGVTATAEKPNSVGARQISVQALPRGPKGSASTDNQEESAAAHYVVSLPELKAASERGKNNAIPDKSPSPPTRKVSVQPALLDFFENKDAPPNQYKRCATLEGFRSVSVRMNGGKTFESFQMGPL